VTGLGFHSVTDPHDRQSWYTNSQATWMKPVPGILVFGASGGTVNTTFPAIATLPIEHRYADSHGDIQENEFTIFETMTHYALYAVLAGGGKWDPANDPFVVGAGPVGGTGGAPGSGGTAGGGGTGGSTGSATGGSGTGGRSGSAGGSVGAGGSAGTSGSGGTSSGRGGAGGSVGGSTTTPSTSSGGGGVSSGAGGNPGSTGDSGGISGGAAGGASTGSGGAGGAGGSAGGGSTVTKNAASSGCTCSTGRNEIARQWTAAWTLLLLGAFALRAIRRNAGHARKTHREE